MTIRDTHPLSNEWVDVNFRAWRRKSDGSPVFIAHLDTFDAINEVGEVMNWTGYGPVGTCIIGEPVANGTRWDYLYGSLGYFEDLYERDFDRPEADPNAPKAEPFYDQVVAYLTNRQRSISLDQVGEALRDLAGQGFYKGYSDQENTRAFLAYLDRNPQGFCDDGIEKAKAALGLQQVTKQFTITVTGLSANIEALNIDWSAVLPEGVSFVQVTE